MTLQERFDSFVSNLPPIQLPEKCLVISDVHASDGGNGDPLIGSGVEKLLIQVLREFRIKDYFLLMNGDWWDTWRAESLTKIFPAHPALVSIIDEYKSHALIYQTLGNHERDLCSYPEVIIFEGFGKKIFMDHGWIGDTINDEFWRIARQSVHMANELGIDPETSPHPENVDRHLAVQEMRHKLADDNLNWDYLWGHTHYFEDIRNNHNSGTPLNGFVQGYLIEEGNFIPLERR